MAVIYARLATSNIKGKKKKERKKSCESCLTTFLDDRLYGHSFCHFLFHAEIFRDVFPFGVFFFPVARAACNASLMMFASWPSNARKQTTRENLTPVGLEGERDGGGRGGGRGEGGD